MEHADSNPAFSLDVLMWSCMVDYQEFEVAVHMGNLQSQRDVLEQCKQNSGFSAESMLKLAAFSKGASHSTPEIARDALNAALKLLLAKGHAVQYDQVAQVLHAFGNTAGKPVCITTCAKCLGAGHLR